MAVNRNNYGLPDNTLQLIAGSPELSVPMMQQGVGTRTDLISALRGISGPANPGFTRYANAANGSSLTPAARKPLNVISPARLTLAKYVAPEVTLPGAEPPDVPPYVPPYVPSFVNNDVIDDDIVDDDIVDDAIVDDRDVLDDPVEDDGTEVTDDAVDDDVVDGLDIDFDDSWLDDVVVPEEKEKTGIVDMEVVDGLEAQDDGTTDGILDLINAGLDVGSDRDGTVIIEPVDPYEEFPQDDGTTADILDLINYLNSASGGGGKPQMNDVSWGELEF